MSYNYNARVLERRIVEWRKKYGIPMTGDFDLPYDDGADLIDVCAHGGTLRLDPFTGEHHGCVGADGAISGHFNCGRLRAVDDLAQRQYWKERLQQEGIPGPRIFERERTEDVATFTDIQIQSLPKSTPEGEAWLRQFNWL